MKRKPGDIISQMCTKNYDIMYGSWDMVHKTDGKSDILRWVPHLKMNIQFAFKITTRLNFLWNYLILTFHMEKFLGSFSPLIKTFD